MNASISKETVGVPLDACDREVGGVTALGPEDVERIARRAAELMRDELEALLASRCSNVTTSLVDVATVATALGVSQKYVRAHARDLGGRQLATGSLWRFDLAAALAAREEPPQLTQMRAPRRARANASVSSSAPLLPIRGRCE